MKTERVVFVNGHRLSLTLQTMDGAWHSYFSDHPDALKMTADDMAETTRQSKEYADKQPIAKPDRIT